MRHFLIGIWEFAQILVVTIGFVATIFAIMGVIGIVHMIVR